MPACVIGESARRKSTAAQSGHARQNEKTSAAFDSAVDSLLDIEIHRREKRGRSVGRSCYVTRRISTLIISVALLKLIYVFANFCEQLYKFPRGDNYFARETTLYCGHFRSNNSVAPSLPPPPRLPPPDRQINELSRRLIVSDGKTRHRR